MAMACIVGLAAAGTLVSCVPDYNLWAGESSRRAARQDASSNEVKKVAGELATLTSRRLTLETREEVVAVLLSHETRITIDGRKARLADLQQRQFAEVTAHEQAGKLIARAVAARSKMQ